jgi:hypothetical protein
MSSGSYEKVGSVTPRTLEPVRDNPQGAARAAGPCGTSAPTGSGSEERSSGSTATVDAGGIGMAKSDHAALLDAMRNLTTFHPEHEKVQS